MKSQLFVLFFFVQLVAFSQCDNFHFAEIGYEPAHCRVSSDQTGNAVVYASAIGGTGPCTYTWTNQQTGQTTFNTTWGGLNVGEYKIVATDSIGCILVEIVKVDSVLPQADFEIGLVQLDSAFDGSLVAEVQFINQSKNACGPIVLEWDQPCYTWTFNGSTEESVLYYHEDFSVEISGPGFYEVCLVAENKNQCKDTLCQSVSISPAVFENEQAQLFYSSLTGVISVELLTTDDAYLTLTNLTGGSTLEILIEPGTNTFSIDPGIYAYQLINTASSELILSGSLVIGE